MLTNDRIGVSAVLCSDRPGWNASQQDAHPRHQRAVLPQTLQSCHHHEGSVLKNCSKQWNISIFEFIEIVIIRNLILKLRVFDF